MTTTTRSITESRPSPTGRGAIAAAAAALLAYALGMIGVYEAVWAVEAVVIAGLVGGAVVSMIRRRRNSESAVTTIGEALLMMAAALIAARWALGAGLELYGLVLLVTFWVVSTAPGRVALGAVSAVIGVEAASHWLGTAATTSLGLAPVESMAGIDTGLMATRLGLVVAVGALAWAIVGRRAARRRRKYQREVEKQRRRLLEEAREFRLIHAGRAESPVGRKEAQELIVRDAVEAVHHTIFVTLEMVKTALDAHTVILLWFDVANERLHIKELISDSDDIVEGGVDPAGGVIGGITRQRESMRLSELRSDFRGLAYYRDAPAVTEFLGVPVIEEGHLRGVLCVDRCDGQSFDDGEQHIVEDAADYVMRAVENERMVASIEQTRFEVGRFYEASRQLNGVLTPEQVYEVGLDSVRQIAAYDFAAIALYDEESDRHRVMEVDGQAAKTPGDWDDVEFESNQGLASMVVRNRHYLPVGGQLRERQACVLTEEQDFSRLESLVVLPLIAQDKAVGTMMVGHREAEQFPTERREMLEVVANQIAVTLQNARMFEEMETMAKFDGLTGLANRRHFQTKLEETMARHKRAGRTFGLILTDIDHFKSVNDTYGHPVGDEVLRQVGRVFSEQMREIDVPARYGGEEFAMILEDTDLDGARLVAERLRKAIAALEFETDQGLLQCTISLGVAVGPWDSDEPHTLVDLADQALYHSKENGRDQVSVYRHINSSGAAA